jgi:signal transduction histidine kinase
MHRAVLRPIVTLDQASRALAAGDLTVRVDMPGQSEIARFGQTFNRMGQNLQESHEKLRQREQFLQGLIDADPDGVRVIDSDYHIIMANRTYCEQVGQSPEQALRSHCYASSHGRDTPCPPTLVTCPLHEIEQTGTALKCAQRFLRPNGGALQVEVFAAPLTIENNGRSQTLIVESIRDLAKQIRYSHEQKLADLGELAAGVAHEIHNPLGSIRMALQGMDKAAAQDVSMPAELKDYLHLVNGEIDHCIEVTNRLLRLSALPGKQPELVAVNQAVEETLSLLRYEAEQQGIRLRFSLAAASPRIMAADSDLRMVALNLAQNAFHAMPQGGELHVASRVAGGEVELLFDDTGAGIAADVLPRIFDPFFSKRADGKKGTGLGLTISKSLVERYGGRIEVQAAQPRGTRFRLVFPDADSATLETAGDTS